MKKVFMSLICLLLMMTASLSAKAQEITVTLLPGCTWISYTRAEAMSITAALGDFVPMQGDVIKSQYGSATYNHGRWMGRLQQFSPGLGYMYISMRSEPVSLVFATPSTLEGALTVSTSEPMDITATTAICGGSAISIDGTSILMKGVCWATHPYPTTDDEYTENGSGSGSFSAELTELVLNTVYYVRAYAVTVKGINYGNELSFIANHDYVDLGLPSGTLWATCNVGAYVPEAYGDYFAWGETEPKSNYNWSTYQYCNGSSSKLTKYCTNSSYGYNGFTDDLTTLLPEDDAATANWGDDWRMPTKEEWQELYNNTTCTWTTLNGVDGRLFTAANGNSIFLPAAGYRNGTSFSGSTGDYLSSTLYSNIPSRAWELNFGSDNCSMSSYGHRKLGLSVRAVRVLRNHDYVDLGLPSGTMWATCNVGANTPGEYGGYFAWGETTPKSSNSWWDTYQYCNGTFWYEWYDEGYEEWDGYEIPLLTKYCTDSYYGYNGFTDNLTTLLPEDDAATANWGAGWRMPTSEEWIELRNNTTSTRMTQNGVQGHLLTASNGNSLFLPDAFYSSFSSWGHYWSCSLNAGNPSGAWSFYIDYYYSTDMRAEDRCNGLFVRAVHCKNSVINVTANPEEGGSVSGGGTYMDHTNCTLTAMAKEGYTFVCWTDHGEVVSTNASYTFVVTGNRELVANFSLPLTITASVNLEEGGTVTGAGAYDYGTECMLMAVPNEGYTFINWTDHGEVVSTNASYSFIVTGDRELVANFSLPFTIMVSINPEEGGTIAGAGEYDYGTECMLMAVPNEGYTFINWTENGIEVSSEASYSFTVTGDRNLEANFANFVDPNTHYYVDLGLPSGLLWATCNVGACVPEAYGDHFAWGETTPKNTYNWYTYQYCNIEDIWELGGETVFLSKYCTLSDFGGEDDLTILLPEDDAATANWGAGWRMPTSEEWSELLNNTTSTWTTQNGVNGRLFTASNGNSLFLPAAGNRWDDELDGAGYYGNYWSSSLGMTYWDPEDPYNPYLAGYFNFSSGNFGMGNSERSNGLSVRPVREN